jgi:hypothetical protein
MAMQFDIPEGIWFRGEDKIISTPVYGPDDVTPVNATGWGLRYVLARTSASSVALIDKNSTTPGQITVTGSFSVDPNLNEQRVSIVIDSEDTDAIKAGTYYHSLKRTDPGNENILFYGDAILSQVPTR